MKIKSIYKTFREKVVKGYFNERDLIPLNLITGGP
jgi:hypothetical protein